MCHQSTRRCSTVSDTVGARLACKTLGHVIKPYRRKYESHGSDRHRGEMFLESHAVVILVLEP
jgi:hypothetical protein